MMKRLFIALPLEKPGLKELEDIVSSLSQYSSSLKMVPLHQYHITLKFLGDTPESRINEIRDGFRSLSSGAINYRIRGIGAFPSVSAPSVIWAGIDADPILKDLAQRVDDYTHSFGFPAEKRSFSPHLTLARIRRECNAPPALVKLINNSREKILGEGTFRKLVLFESVLSKTGPSHNELVTLSLNGE